MIREESKNGIYKTTSDLIQCHLMTLFNGDIDAQVWTRFKNTEQPFWNAKDGQKAPLTN